MCGFSSPSLPDPEPAPAPPPEPSDPEAEQKKSAEIRRRAAARGRGSTILTSGLGVTSPPTTAGTTILGRTQ